MCQDQSLRSACAYTQSDQSLCLLLEYFMSAKLLTEHHLEFLSLKGGSTGSSESPLVKMPYCWKLRVTAQMCFVCPTCVRKSLNKFGWIRKKHDGQTDRLRQSQYSKQFSKHKGINMANIITHLLYLFKKSVQCLSVHHDLKSLKYPFFKIILKSHFALQIYAMDTFT